ncbi:hypothetical protein ARMSODRAFT_983404 [Armillaria solidipes]|uniref:Uncharacterized protein n=1 Tax=Armillaria solidipes TaxID=1076256 RepID=A0A2H3AJ66_9AGAR|nr:hypothetical protein ARMSODRAFT_983404 [Armillaria solidipes]
MDYIRRRKADTAALCSGAADAAIDQLPLEVRSLGPVSTCERRVTNVPWVHSHHLYSGCTLRAPSCQPWFARNDTGLLTHFCPRAYDRTNYVAMILNRYRAIFCFQFRAPEGPIYFGLASREITSFCIGHVLGWTRAVRTQAVFSRHSVCVQAARGWTLIRMFFAGTPIPVNWGLAQRRCLSGYSCGDFGTAIKKKPRNLRDFVGVLMPNVVLFQRELEYSPNHPFFGLVAGQNKFGKRVKLLKDCHLSGMQHLSSSTAQRITKKPAALKEVQSSGP